MGLGMYNRIKLQDKNRRIIDLFETYQAQKDVFVVDETFAFRTRAERFRALNQTKEAHSHTIQGITNMSVDNSHNELITHTDHEVPKDNFEIDEIKEISRFRVEDPEENYETGWRAIYH